MSFYVKVKDSNGKDVFVEVSFEVHELFEDERKYQQRIQKEFKRHRTDEEFIEDYMLPSRLHTISISDKVFYQHEIQKAEAIIATCTETQQRRFHLHRILGYSFSQIAEFEGCSKVAVKKSVDTVANKIKTAFKK